MKIISDAKLITNKSNIAYLSNFTGSAGFILLTKNKKYLFTDFRYIERAKQTIKKNIKIINITRVWRNPKDLSKTWQSILKKHKIKILGIEESDLTVTRYKKFKKISKKIRFVDVSGEIEKIREIKTPKEIELIIKSQRINEKVFLAIKKIIQDYCRTAFGETKCQSAQFHQKPQTTSSTKPLREIDIAWMIKKLAHDFGAQDISFDPIVSFGPHSARPHHEPDTTPLKKGDIIMIDMGMKYKGYCSDMTRMIFTSKPTEKQEKIYTLVLKAQENAIKKIKAGISGKKADNLSRDIINKAGFKEQYGHAGGHGIGLDVHEIPSLAETYKNPLKLNSIVTVEPGIYLEGEFGIRIEDMILIAKHDNKNLTKIPKNIRNCIL